MFHISTETHRYKLDSPKLVGRQRQHEGTLKLKTYSATSKHYLGCHLKANRKIENIYRFSIDEFKNLFANPEVISILESINAGDYCFMTELNEKLEYFKTLLAKPDEEPKELKPLLVMCEDRELRLKASSYSDNINLISKIVWIKCAVICPDGKIELRSLVNKDLETTRGTDGFDFTSSFKHYNSDLTADVLFWKRLKEIINSLPN